MYSVLDQQQHRVSNEYNEYVAACNMQQLADAAINELLLQVLWILCSEPPDCSRKSRETPQRPQHHHQNQGRSTWLHQRTLHNCQDLILSYQSLVHASIEQVWCYYATPRWTPEFTGKKVRDATSTSDSAWGVGVEFRYQVRQPCKELHVISGPSTERLDALS